MTEHTTEQEATCATCRHAVERHSAQFGCMVERGNSGSGSVADAVFCRCDKKPYPRLLLNGAPDPMTLPERRSRDDAQTGDKV